MTSKASQTQLRPSVERRKRTHSQTQDDIDSDQRTCDSALAINPGLLAIEQFFQQPSKLFSKADHHTDSPQTRSYHFFDLHLHPDLRLKEVVILDNLLDNLSRSCDKVIQERLAFLANAEPLPESRKKERKGTTVVKNEDTLVHGYQKLNKQYLKIASGLVFQIDWETIFDMTTGDTDRKEAIADAFMTFDDEHAEKYLSEDDLSNIALLRKYLLDTFIIWEFKSLTCGPSIMENIPLFEGKFTWTACEERSDHDESSTTCNSPAGSHRTNGMLLVTGRQTGPDSTIIEQLIENSGCSRDQLSKRPRREIELLTKSDSVKCWTQLVAEDASIGVISVGNEEYIVMRHRGTQTLYLSPLIKCTTDTCPSHSKILIACYMLGFNDALERAQKLETIMNSPSAIFPERYQLKLDKLPSYVKNNLQLAAWPKNNDQAIILSLQEQRELCLRFHDEKVSGILGGPGFANMWILRKNLDSSLHTKPKGGDNSEELDTDVKPNTPLFLDFQGRIPLVGKTYPVYLGVIDKDSNIPKYYSKPMLLKMARNAVECNALEKEHEIYKQLQAKGVKAIVPMHGLFSSPGLPNHRILLLEDGGKTVTVRQNNKTHKTHLTNFRDKYLQALAEFHHKNIAIRNIMNDHILMNDNHKVALISLASVSFSPSSDDMESDTDTFQKAIVHSNLGRKR